MHTLLYYVLLHANIYMCVCKYSRLFWCEGWFTFGCFGAQCSVDLTRGQISEGPSCEDSVMVLPAFFHTLYVQATSPTKQENIEIKYAGSKHFEDTFTMNILGCFVILKKTTTWVPLYSPQNICDNVNELSMNGIFSLTGLLEKCISALTNVLWWCY